MTRRAGCPPPPSSHHHDRTRTLVSWAPRHIVTPLVNRTPNEKPQVNTYYYVRPMDDIREDPSRVPLLVFFPVKPQPHYKGEGRVERNGTLEKRGSLDQHNLTWGNVGVVSVPLKATSSDLNRCPKKDHHQEKGARDVRAQAQASKVVEVLGEVGERNPRWRG